MAEGKSDNLPITPEPKKRVTRRAFLRGLFGFAGLALTNSGLFRLLQGEPVTDIQNEVGPFGQFIDVGYPTVSWVRANLAVGVERLDGITIPSHGRFSLLDSLFPNQNSLDVTNTDPKKGFVFGLAHGGNSLITLVAANGICKLSTDLFRCALASPIIIKESHSHTNISPNHISFRNYPVGTDASVFFRDNDIGNSDRWDLVLVNPWDVPVKLHYKIADKDGKILDPSGLKDRLEITDYAVGQWMKIMEGLEEQKMPFYQGIIPNAFAVVPITSVIMFEPMVSKQELPRFTKWSIKIGGPVKQPDNSMRLTRQLFIENQLVDNYVRSSTSTG